MTNVIHLFKEKGGKEQHQMVQRILSGSWEEQQQAAKEVLGGVGIAAIEGKALPQTGSTFVIPPELMLLTDDASRKETGGRLTLEQFTFMLDDFGFPFAEGKDPVLLMQNGIRDWVKAALEDPNQPGAHAPLFLQAMANQQLPAIDLTAEDWDPTEYRLTYLEMEVFLGAFIQALPQEQKQATGLLEWLGGETAYAADAPGPCTYAKEWFTKLGEKNGVGTLTGFNIGIINQLASALTGKAIDALGELVGTVMSVVGLAMKVMKLGMLYWSIEVKVEPTPGMVHKQAPDEADQEITYVATAGVNEQKYKSYLDGWSATPLAKQIKDCLSFAGLPMPTDTGEIAADVENWSVEWDLVQGGGTHALIGLDHNNFDYKGQLQMKLQRVDKIKGQAKLVVDVTDEKVKKHEGKEKIATVTARAVVETSAPPELALLLGGVSQGADEADSGVFELLSMTDTLIDLAAGWFQELVEPEAFGYTHVTYHAPEYIQYSYEGWISAVSQWEESNELDGGSETYRTNAYGRWNVTFSSLSDLKFGPMIVSDSQGNVKLTSQYSIYTSGTGECAGGTVTHTSEGSSSGQFSYAGKAEGKLSRADSGNGEYNFTFEPIVGVMSDSLTEHPVKITNIQTPHGCEFVGSAKWDNEKSIYPTIDFDQIKASMTSKEAYPETITGSQSFTTETGAKVIWTWKLTRVEGNPKAKNNGPISSKPVGG
ncbi:hypothetical protein [Paenibacillus montanisoli]|nr:hypothetical protein [Paenibacillus montanisoli]